MLRTLLFYEYLCLNTFSFGGFFMKRFALIALLLVSSTALAAPKSAPANSGGGGGHVRSMMTHGEAKMMLAGPLTLIDGTLYLGPAFFVTFEVYPGLFVGGETGFHLHPGTPSAWVIPIMPTALYHLPMNMGPGVDPFIGMGMGLGIAHASNAFTSASSTDFALHFHMGANFSENLMAEVKLGVIGSAFVFSPAFGYRF